MKNVSLAINAVLAILIVVLFFMYSSLKKSINPQGATTSVKQDSGMQHTGPLRIAYVNADTINADYKLMKDFKDEIQQRQTALQNEYDTKGQRLQQEYVEYQQKAQAGNISQVDAEKKQKDMQQKKNELDAIQAKQSDLMKEVQDRNLQIQNKVQDYITKYNKKTQYDYVLTYVAIGGNLLYANKSYDITKEIVDGLNKEYTDSVQSANAKH